MPRIILNTVHGNISIAEYRQLYKNNINLNMKYENLLRWVFIKMPRFFDNFLDMSKQARHS